MLNEITPVIITFNEAPNIARTLSKLTWAREVVIVDSHSRDQTRELAMAAHPSVRWLEHTFTTHAEQWTHALEFSGITTEWVLALDADYVLTDALVEELKQLRPTAATNGFEARFVYCIDGQPLRCGTYPPVVVLFRHAHAKFEQDGHAHRVRVDGGIEKLAHPILHDDRKPLSHWLASQAKYMRLEADKLATTPASELALIDRVRRWIVVAPPAMFVYCLVVRAGILDGWAGVYYAMQRTVAESILSLNILERMAPRWRR